MMILFFGLYLSWFPISGHVPFLLPLLQGDWAPAFANLPARSTTSAARCGHGLLLAGG